MNSNNNINSNTLKIFLTEKNQYTENTCNQISYNSLVPSDDANELVFVSIKSFLLLTAGTSVASLQSLDVCFFVTGRVVSELTRLSRYNSLLVSASSTSELLIGRFGIFTSDGSKCLVEEREIAATLASSVESSWSNCEYRDTF